MNLTPDERHNTISEAAANMIWPAAAELIRTCRKWWSESDPAMSQRVVDALPQLDRTIWFPALEPENQHKPDGLIGSDAVQRITSPIIGLLLINTRAVLSMLPDRELVDLESTFPACPANYLSHPETQTETE
jgi:hypothetical protein